MLHETTMRTNKTIFFHQNSLSKKNRYQRKISDLPRRSFTIEAKPRKGNLGRNTDKDYGIHSEFTHGTYIIWMVAQTTMRTCIVKQEI